MGLSFESIHSSPEVNSEPASEPDPDPNPNPSLKSFYSILVVNKYSHV